MSSPENSKHEERRLPGGAYDAPVIELRNVNKGYNGIAVLKDIRFSVRRGEVVGLVGENGAGKSTMLKCITGLATPDSGEILAKGTAQRFASYSQANEAGIFQVFQELSFVPNISVGENFFLCHERKVTSRSWLERSASNAKAQEILNEFGYAHIDASRPAHEFDVATRQLLEILKAFALSRVGGHDVPLILLDEPTASLSNEEVNVLHTLLTRIRDRAAIIFISHRLTEVIEWSDRLIVLKDGTLVGDVAAKSVSEGELHAMMVGRKRDEGFYKESRQRLEFDKPVLSVRDLSVKDAFRRLSFEIRQGEILGIGGVLGSGKSEVGRAIFGDIPRASGEIVIKGESIPRALIGEMVKKGVGYLSPERSTEGLLSGLPIDANISIASLPERSYVLNLGRERSDAVDFIKSLRVRTRGPEQTIETLSGGNQQKVLLARWLIRDLSLLILDNPTRGVDAGAKEEIYDALRDLTDRGVAILLITDDLLELIGLSNRILVLKDGAQHAAIDCAPDDKPAERAVVAQMV